MHIGQIKTRGPRWSDRPASWELNRATTYAPLLLPSQPSPGEVVCVTNYEPAGQLHPYIPPFSRSLISHGWQYLY